MKLSAKGRYAVMAMCDLAGQSGGKPIALADIAERQEGLVRSVRGPGGGYMLAHGADNTRIADIVLAVDEPIQTTRCTPGQPFGCRSNRQRCLTHDLWEALGNQIYLFLASVSLGDVVSGRIAADQLARPEDARHPLAAQQ
jgi:Rrf2 family iron-sulfur cluster assembly transcriptional regulator